LEKKKKQPADKTPVAVKMEVVKRTTPKQDTSSILPHEAADEQQILQQPAGAGG
jgi:hypothetical protein